MRSILRLGLAVIAVVAASLATTTASAAAGTTGCSAQLDHVARTLTAGRTVGAGQLRTVQRCLLGDAGSASMAPEQVETVGAAAVEASFQNQYVCFNFNSDRTISSSLRPAR